MAKRDARPRLTTQALGMLIGCTFKSKEVAMQVMPLAILPIMIFGGLFVNLETIPKWLHWIQYISPIKYSFNAMLIEEFSNLDQLTCKPGACPRLRIGRKWLIVRA